jgi:uncharacterized protein GlcG (DUF336 family)
MTRDLIETLEVRRLLSGSASGCDGDGSTAVATAALQTSAAAAPAGVATVQPYATSQSAATAASGQKAKKGRDKKDGAALAASTALSAQDVQTILAQAASQARPTQAVAVVDRGGTLLGLIGNSGLKPADADKGLFAFTGEVVQRAIERARTAANFQSRGEAFTTRTARFIIQNHFPQPIRNTGGGPLYGVEFANLQGSDVILGDRQGPFSGDPGGIPLYINGIPVGGVGVAGDLSDTAPVPNFKDIFSAGPYGSQANPDKKVFGGEEEPDFDESVALAGARGYSAPARIRSTQIFVGGLRFPFTASRPAHGQPDQTLAQLTSGGSNLFAAPSQGLPTATTRDGEPERTNAVFANVPGLLRITSNVGAVDPTTGVPNPALPHTDPFDSDPIIGSNDTDANGVPLTDAQRLTAQDGNQIINDAVAQAAITRAGIRKPNGLNARVHVAVVDRDGTVLGVFKMEDGTNFSYDIAVQKARTAAYFSDDQHAFTPRAMGFMAQKFFPPGIDTGLRGPLYQFQDTLSFGPNFSELLNGKTGQNMNAIPAGYTRPPLANGITIFPGGVPLYKNGVLVGGVGVSGDGVDQDDIIAFSGGKGFQPPANIRCDNLDRTDAAGFIVDKLEALEAAPNTDFHNSNGELVSDAAKKTILEGLHETRLPFVKFPRNPHV